MFNWLLRRLGILPKCDAGWEEDPRHRFEYLYGYGEYIDSDGETTTYGVSRCVDCKRLSVEID